MSTLLADAPPGRVGIVLGDQLRAERARLRAEAPHGAAFASALSRATDEGLRGVAAALRLDGVAVLATGGYGRGRLAPYSDVDLLLLTRRGEAGAAEPLLYPLWDAGLPVSQAVHDPAGAAEAAEADLTTRTAFLDARLIWGDEALWADFRSRYDALRRATAPEFAAGKLAEREERHAAQDASRYAIEPDLKEGKGGLRDLDLLHWLDRYSEGVGTAPIQGAQTPGLFTPEEARRLRRCQDFLWSVRVPLHEAHGRADERVTFAVQPALAEALRYKDRPGAPAPERLMRHYFLNATEVGRLTGAACAALEERMAAQVPSPRFSLGRLFRDRVRPEEPAPLPAPLDPRLSLRAGRLTLTEPDAADVPLLFVLFEAAGAAGLRVHPDAMAAAARASRRLGRAERADPELAARFRAVLTDAVDPPRILRRMSECGLLGRYLPAYGRVVGRTEYGLYRRYTLDEHVLRSCEVFHALRDGPDDPAFAITQPVARACDPVEAYLTLLLQETKRGMTRPTEARALRRIERTAARFLDQEAAARAAFCAQRIDFLARTAARRAVTDPATVARVARRIGTRDRLDQLALVTACRHRTAGAGSWRAYRNRDARLLVEEARAYLDEGEAGLARYAAARRLRLRARAAERTSLPHEALERFFARAGPEFWSMASPEAAARLAEIVTSADEAGETVAVSVAAEADGTVRAVVYSPDRTGLFGDVAGVVAEAGGTVWGASAFSLAAPGVGGADRAVTIVQMLRPGTPPEPYALAPSEAERVRARLVQIARDGAPPPRLPGRNVSDRRAVFTVPPAVRLYPDESPDSLIVEAEGLDRPGLLHLLAEEIEAAGASVRRAFVATQGERAIDTFYLQDAESRKLSDGAVIEALEARLTAVLADD